MTFQQDDLFKNDNSFGAVSQHFVFPRVVATGFVAEIDGSFPGKAPRISFTCHKRIFFST